jgi:hypothetical protein
MTNPIANSGQFAAERDVIAMWGDVRVKAARAQVERLFQMGYADRIPEASRPLLPAFCDEYATNWLFKAAASDAQHPRFVRGFMPAHRWNGHDVPGARTGGDNPNNCYRLAGIAHGTAYRITGRILDRKPANISFTLTANYGTSRTIQTLEDHDMVFDENGAFVITIDDQPANGRPNHMTTVPEVKLLFVRDSMMDWASETPLEMEIERLSAATADPISVDEMAARAAFRMMDDFHLYFWFQNVWSGMTPNTIISPTIHRGAGGLVTQALSLGNYCLGEDDVAILEYNPAGAGYAGVQLTEWLYRSLDYHKRQSSLTAHHSAVDGDGLIRVVIAQRDPGVANWLDTGGVQEVFHLLRWQALAAEPVNGGPSASLRMSTHDRLKDDLPSDTTWVDTAQRKAQLEARLAAYQRRITV